MRPEDGRSGDRHGVEPLEDAALHVEEQPERGVGDARGNGHDQDAGQQVVHIGDRPGVDRAAEDVDEQQHEGDRHDRRRDDRVRAARDVAQGPSQQDGGVTEEVLGHGDSLLTVSRADEGEEDVFEGRLLLDVLDLGGRQQQFQLGEGAVHDDPTLVEDRDPVGELFGLVQVLRGEQHRGPAPGELLDGPPHLESRLGVETGRRLVEEDDRWVPDQAHRDVESTAHAA